jgi:hypothetical protein
MTPGLDWRALYHDSPGALTKLEYCDATVRSLRDRTPDVTDAELDLEVKDIKVTVHEFYQGFQAGEVLVPRSLDGDLKMIFARWAPRNAPPTERKGDAALLFRRHQDLLANSVYRWTGVDPSILYPVIVHLAARAKELGLTYPMSSRDEILVELSGFMTTLAMNYVYRGKLIAG